VIKIRTKQRCARGKRAGSRNEKRVPEHYLADAPAELKSRVGARRSTKIVPPPPRDQSGHVSPSTSGTEARRLQASPRQRYFLLTASAASARVVGWNEATDATRINQPASAGDQLLGRGELLHPERRKKGNGANASRPY
jgi:hypothetical protein